MCNEQRRLIALDRLREDWSQTRIPLYFPEGLPNLAPMESIRITDSNAIIRAAASKDFPAEGSPAAELVVRRWSWPGPSGRPVYNFRSDGRTFNHGRCLIVADGFYEFTTPEAPGKKRKDKWLFTLAASPWFCIAGLWRDDPVVGEAYTMLTCPPGPDVAPFHDRQMAVLGPESWGPWLDPSVPASNLIGPLPAGTLNVAPVGR